jgi:predicted nucleic acid-binding protein
MQYLLTASTPTVGDVLLIYIDTSAAVKLVRREAQSEELSLWIRGHLSPEFVSSVIIEVELPRATRRSAPANLARAGHVLDGIGIVTLSPAIVTRAAGFDEHDLRSLDAIHLATAEHVANTARSEFLGFLGYDSRLLEAARKIGLPVLAPGLL